MVVGTLNASGGVVAGAIDGVGGTSDGDTGPGVPEHVLQHQGTPDQNLQWTAGSQLCEDVVNHQLYMASGLYAGGSDWSQLA